MTYHKFSQSVANWELRRGEELKDYERNMRILIANGLTTDVARAMATHLLYDEIQHPRSYLNELLRHSENFAQEYLQYLGIKDVPEPEPFEVEEVYTTPIKRRLRERALRIETELLRERLLGADSDFFWRDDSKRLTGRSTPTA